MGFQKGSITLNPRKDIPLLLQVLRSRFITHDQLRDFMLLDDHERGRKRFNWRVRRLVQGGLLNRECARPITPSPVYSITPVAALLLAEHCAVLDNGKRKEASSLMLSTMRSALTSCTLLSRHSEFWKIGNRNSPSGRRMN